MEILQLDEERVLGLFDWGKRLAETAALQPALFNDVRDERVAAEADLLEILLATLRVASDLEPSRSDRKSQTQSRIVKKAETHALSNPDDRL